jgi:hypothetical protein
VPLQAVLGSIFFGEALKHNWALGVSIMVVGVALVQHSMGPGATAVDKEAGSANDDDQKKRLVHHGVGPAGAASDNVVCGANDSQQKR